MRTQYVCPFAGCPFAGYSGTQSPGAPSGAFLRARSDMIRLLKRLLAKPTPKPAGKQMPPCDRCGSTRYRVNFCPDCGLQHCGNYDLRAWFEAQQYRLLKQARLAELSKAIDQRERQAHDELLAITPL